MNGEQQNPGKELLCEWRAAKPGGTVLPFQNWIPQAQSLPGAGQPQADLCLVVEPAEADLPNLEEIGVSGHRDQVFGVMGSAVPQPRPSISISPASAAMNSFGTGR